MPRWLDTGLLRSAELDRRGARVLHGAVAKPLLLRLCTGCSRLGDGVLWVLLMPLLPLLDGQEGAQCARLVLGLGSVNLLIYWALKRGTRRMRPFDSCEGIRARMAVPDRFSFPSGHTVHASAFAVLLTAFYPPLGPLLCGFAALVGVSRVVLGLHYPSDVVVGALIGVGTASLALCWR